MQAGPYGPYGNSEDFGDLGVRQTFLGEQRQDDALSERKCGQGRAEPLAQLLRGNGIAGGTSRGFEVEG